MVARANCGVRNDRSMPDPGQDSFCARRVDPMPWACGDFTGCLRIVGLRTVCLRSGKSILFYVNFASRTGAKIGSRSLPIIAALLALPLVYYLQAMWD